MRLLSKFKSLLNSFSILFNLLFVGFTVLNTLFSTWPLYNRSVPLLLLFLLLSVVLLCFLYRVSNHFSYIYLNHRIAVIFFSVLLFFIIQLIFGVNLRHLPNTDAEQCFTAAKQLATTGHFETSARSYTYFSWYPFNLGIVYFLSLIFKFFSFFNYTDFYFQTILICGILFSAGFYCAIRSSEILGGHYSPIFLIFLYFLNTPLLYCTSEIYTDAFAVSFIPMILYSYLCYKSHLDSNHDIVYFLLFIITSILGFLFRVTVLIISIGCLCDLFFSEKPKSSLLLIFLFIICVNISNIAINETHYRYLGKENVEQHRLSFWHYLAMGLPVQEDQGYGQYNDGGWLIFSTSFDNAHSRDEALRLEVKNRIYTLRKLPILINLLSRKNLSTFGDGTFGLHYLIEADYPEADGIIKNFIFHRGNLFVYYYHFCTSLFMSLFLFLMLELFILLKNKNLACFPLCLTLTGSFIFLSLWETNARYFFQFLPVLIILCSILYMPRINQKNT